MKLIAKSLLVILLVLSAVSCKKDDSTPSNEMSCLINGKSWNSSIRVSVLQSGVLTVTGTSLLGEIVALTVKGETTGTYTLSLSPASAQCGATYKASAVPATTDIYASVSGKVVITKFDKTSKIISGTFEFTLANSALTPMNITQGQFNNISYQ